MPNLHSSGPDTLAEICAREFDLLPACIVSTTWPTAPGSGTTIPAFATQGYVRRGTLLYFVDQPARAITLPSADGTYYLALTTDTHSTVGSFTRVPGSHYAYLQSASAPTYPDGTTPIASATVASGNITAVDTAPALSPPLSRQTADAVAITGGAISVGGHAPTGVLDVQGSVQASDAANNYYSVRVWPVAPSGAANVYGVRIEPPTGAALATASFRAFNVPNPPTMGTEVIAYHANIAAGTGRYNIRAEGNAQNYFAGNVGIGNVTPSYPLDVSGQARITQIGLNTAPGGGTIAQVLYANNHGILLMPTVDTGFYWALGFLNTAGTPVGSITTNASTTFYNTSSDRRLKRNVQPLTDALATLRQLRPVRFLWNYDDSSGIGFLAHEAQAVIPESVTGLPDQVDAQGNIVPQGMDHSKLVPWLVGALQEVTQRLEALEEALGV